MTIAANPTGASDVRTGRLDEATLKGNFADLHPLLTTHEARVEAERCYFCFDPPCQQACPTSIDIPLFIRQIAAGNRSGGAPTGKRVAIIGAGPAGLACAHELAIAGVESTIFEPREKAGGLNEYGIAAYKTADAFRAREVDFVLSIGGIEIRLCQALGPD